MTDPLAMFAVGFLLGARHALDADHLAAVSTLAVRSSDLKTSGLIGLCWGLGHTAVLLIAGLVVLLLGLTIPPKLSMVVEFGVGALLVWLGASLARTLLRDRWHLHAHDHEGALHRHLHHHLGSPRHDHPHWLRASVRPTLVGMAHGLAGSAALMLVIVSTVQSWWAGLLYIAVFGLGSIAGMMIVGLLISLPLTLSTAWSRRSRAAIQSLASCASIGLGLAMMIRIALAYPSF